MLGVFEELFFDCSGLHGLFDAPAVDSHLHVSVHGTEDQDCRDKGQNTAGDNSLDDVAEDGPSEQEGA